MQGCLHGATARMGLAGLWYQCQACGWSLASAGGRLPLLQSALWSGLDGAARPPGSLQPLHNSHATGTQGSERWGPLCAPSLPRSPGSSLTLGQAGPEAALSDFIYPSCPLCRACGVGGSCCSGNRHQINTRYLFFPLTDSPLPAAFFSYSLMCLLAGFLVPRDFRGWSSSIFLLPLSLRPRPLQPRGLEWGPAEVLWAAASQQEGSLCHLEGRGC